jgi:hypothetical protein
MSTDHILQALEVCEPAKLVRFLPVFHGSERERRRLSMIPDIYNWLSQPVTGDRLAQLKAATKIHFGQFVKGEEIDDYYFMKRASDKRGGYDNFSGEVWSIRPDFMPRYRFFGAFFRTDWFVVFTKKPRDALKTDQQWHAQLDAVCRDWDSIFPYTYRHSGESLSDYVAFNAEHYDERW